METTRDATDPGRDTAGEVVRAYVARAVDRLIAAEPGLRSGADEPIHDARVATRELRTSLSVYRCVVDRAITDPVRERLAELGRLLGAARDPHVELHSLRRTLRAEPIDLVLGPVALRLDEDRSAAERTGIDLLGYWLASPAWPELRAQLRRLAGELPPGPDAGRPAVSVLPRRAHRAWRGLDSAAARIEPAGSGGPGEATSDEHDERLHEARKAARRARYASEVAIAAVGAPAARSAERAQAVQEALGRQHDTVVRRETLRRVAVLAHLDGENTFTYGRLDALEQAAGEAAERAAFGLIARATSRRHRHWTR